MYWVLLDTGDRVINKTKKKKSLKDFPRAERLTINH